MEKGKRKIKMKVVVPILVLALIVALIIFGTRHIVVTKYVVKDEAVPKEFDGYVIVQISDLHNAEFGKNQSTLIKKIEKVQPDVIVITGDLIDSNRTNIDAAMRFVDKALEISPVYYVTGNHETWSDEFEDLERRLTESGVTVLRNDIATLDYNGASINIIGVDDPAFVLPHDLFKESGSLLLQKINELHTDSDTYTVLLSHRPELFSTYVRTGVNLALTGHAHGGQFRIPFIGGLVAPNQGFFPKYTSGVFSEDNTKMIVSRGLGNSIIPFRINNHPEIVVIELRQNNK